jgi:hypothetical protein
VFRTEAGFEGDPIVGVAIDVFSYICRSSRFEFVRVKHRSA